MVDSSENKNDNLTPIDKVYEEIKEFYTQRHDKANQELGRILLTYTRLTKEQLVECLDIQKKKEQKLGEVLVQKGYLNTDEIQKALSIQLGIPYIDEIPANSIDINLIKGISISYARQNILIPLFKRDDVVFVVVSDPLKFYPLDDLKLLLKCDIKPVISSNNKIVSAINIVYSKVTDDAADVVEGLEGEEGDIDFEEPVDLLFASGDEEAPIIRLINSLLFRAVKQKISDIHIEPYEKEVIVRFRQDGILKEIMRLPKRFQANIISRIKILGKLNTAEKRVPQDGRIPLKLAGKDIDVRLSVVPTVFGERIVMRLLDKSSVILDLEALGFGGKRLTTLDKLIRKSNGIVLVCGPTGSGKSTTLSACVERIKSSEKNIITVEDPVEHQLKGVGQIQVNEKVNLTFADGLRSIVRQDPDVIMVGEIRDVETAGIAINSSLTGHIVFSTIHTNDAAGAISRLVDMGIEPFLIASSLMGVIGQRLVRRLCTKCREEYVPSEILISEIVKDVEKYKGKTFYKAKGCDACGGTGYESRTAIFELLVITEKIRTMILDNADSFSIKKFAMENEGMIPMRLDGFYRAMEGITTLDEVLRVTQEDQ